MNTKKLLVVEDDADVRLGYQILLRAHGYDTCFAADSMSAISEARKQQPDLILLDLGLPAGDGYLVMQRLRQNTMLGLIPIIVVSGRDVSTHRQRALDSGASGYLQKPWNDVDLLQTIADVLGNPASPIAASGVPQSAHSG